MDLLKHKWATFARRRLYRQFGLFLVYFFIYSTAWYLRPTYLETQIIDGTYEANVSNVTLADLHEDCYLLNHNTSTDKICVNQSDQHFICVITSIYFKFGFSLKF